MKLDVGYDGKHSIKYDASVSISTNMRLKRMKSVLLEVETKFPVACPRGSGICEVP